MEIHVSRHMIQLNQSRYLFAGSLTILWAFVLLFIVPDSPTHAGRWFSSAEQELLNKRLKLNKTGRDQTTFKMSHVSEAVRDPKIYFFMFMGYVFRHRFTT